MVPPHHAASKARSALRGWALRNRARELVEHGTGLSAIYFPKALVSARHSAASRGGALLARHALQAIDAVDRRSENDEVLQFFRFDALIWYCRIRGVHEQVYDREVCRCIAEMGAIAHAWPRRDVVGQWARELSGHAIAAESEGCRKYGDPVERALEAEAHFAPELPTIPQLQASILRTKIEAYASCGERIAVEPDISAAASLVSGHRDAVWAQVLKRAAWLACRRFGKGVYSPEADPFRLSSILLEFYLELLRSSSSPQRSFAA